MNAVYVLYQRGHTSFRAIGFVRNKPRAMLYAVTTEHFAWKLGIKELHT